MLTLAALHSIEFACYTGQSSCNLCRNGVVRHVAKEIALCTTTYIPCATLYIDFLLPLAFLYISFVQAPYQLLLSTSEEL